MINQDPGLRRELGSFFKSHEADVKKLLGDVKIVVSERRHANISSILFQKAGFSQIIVPIKENQKCKSGRCLTRSTMNLGKFININGVKVKLDFRWDCSVDSVVYVALCKRCDETSHGEHRATCTSENTSNFYFGQTNNSLMSRCNGHRDKFKLNKYDQSALSLHIYEKHVEYFGEKLNNFDFGIVKRVSPMQLDRVEHDRRKR